jgi:hypothetical protein
LVQGVKVGAQLGEGLVHRILVAVQLQRVPCCHTL